MYHAPTGTIIDPDSSSGYSEVVTDADRKSHSDSNRENQQANRLAMKCFAAAYPGADDANGNTTIRINRIWRCVRVAFSV